MRVSLCLKPCHNRKLTRHMRNTVPLGKIYLVDGSKRSAHSNAYFTGLPFLTKQSENPCIEAE